MFITSEIGCIPAGQKRRVAKDKLCSFGYIILYCLSNTRYVSMFSTSLGTSIHSHQQTVGRTYGMNVFTSSLLVKIAYCLVYLPDHHQPFEPY